MEGLGMNGRPFVSDRAGTQSNWRAVLVVSLVAAVAGCGRGEPDGAAPRGQDSLASKSPVKEIDHDHPVVQIETNQGAITVRLDAVRAPGTVRNFLNYANSGFYDNTIVHYVDP